MKHPDLATATEAPFRPWNGNLGDHWATCNYLITRSWMRREEILLREEHPRLREILSQLEGPERSSVRLVPSGQGPTSQLCGFAVWATPFWPTKRTWQPAQAKKRIVYHLEGLSSAAEKNPPEQDRSRIHTWLGQRIMDGYEVVALGGHQSLEQMIYLAAGAQMFMGVDSGPSHICHSVGLPMFLVEYDLPIITTHRRKHFTHCRGTSELLAAAEAYLVR